MKQLLRRHGGNRGQSTKPQGAQKPHWGVPSRTPGLYQLGEWRCCSVPTCWRGRLLPGFPPGDENSGSWRLGLYFPWQIEKEKIKMQNFCSSCRLLG